MCEHEFERLRHQAEQQSFNSQILGEIEETKRKLKKKILDLRIQGSFYLASQVEANLLWLEKTEESMRRMLNNQGEKP